MNGKQETARLLAGKHYQIEPGISRIFSIWEKPEHEALPSTPIKLLEVNEDTVASGVLPLHFGPAPASGIDYPSVIVEVTPEEFERLQRKELRLPDGWEIGEELFKPTKGEESA